MNKIVYRKAKENVGKLVATKKRWNYLISQPNYILAIEIRKTKILVNKPVYLGLSILELQKILIYEFWYDYVKLKYHEKTNLCCMDTGSFIVYIKTDYIDKDIVEDVETRFDTNYELD